MPRGRRWRRRWREQVSARRINRFVEPCLLLLLHRTDSHGYDLLESLREFGFSEDSLDSSAVYRCLREMENREFVTSTWDTEGGGPPRRVYRLTGEGDEYLAWWIAGLRETRNLLDGFLHAYEEHMQLEDHTVQKKG